MLDYTLLEFEEAVSFLGESRSLVTTINGPPQRERHHRNIIYNRTHERETNRPDERDSFRMTRDQDRKPRPRERSTERQQGRSHALVPPRLGGKRRTPETTHVSTAEKVVCAPVTPDAQVPVSLTKKAKPRLWLTKCAWMGFHGRDPCTRWPRSHQQKKRRV